MTGGDLIVYIVKNGLYDEPIFKDGKFIGFITVEEAAVKMKVGIATVEIWVSQGWLEGVRIGDKLFIPADAKRPELNINGGVYERVLESAR